MNEDLMTNEVEEVEVCETPVNVDGNDVLGKVILVAGTAVATLVGTTLYTKFKNRKKEDEEPKQKRRFQMFDLKKHKEVNESEDTEESDENEQ